MKIGMCDVWSGGLSTTGHLRTRTQQVWGFKLVVVAGIPYNSMYRKLTGPTKCTPGVVDTPSGGAPPYLAQTPTIGMCSRSDRDSPHQGHSLIPV